MTTLPALRAPLPVLVDEVLALTAKLHPDEALARLAPLWGVTQPGLARRALLSARVTLMRQAMTAAPLIVAPPEPEPEAVAEPVFVPAALPKPAALNKGALKLLNLEDAARLLMAGIGDMPEADEKPASKPATAARAAAEADLADVIASEAAAVAKSRPKPAKSKSKGANAPALVMPDLAAQFADLAEDAPATRPAAFDLAAQFAAMDSSAAAPKSPAPDLAAQFAAMDGGDEPPLKPAKKPKAAGLVVDLSAQFAAMDGD